MVWGRTPLPFILITGALQRQLEPGQALMSAHSLSPALCPHIKAQDPPVPGGGKRAAGTLLVPWLLPRAGWTWGRASDRLHQMGLEERGLWGGGSPCCLARAFGAHPSPWLGGLLWHCKRGHRETSLPAPSPPSSLCPCPTLREFWEGPWEGCPVLPQPVSRCLSPSPGLLLCPGTPWQGARSSPGAAETARGAEESNLAMSRCWPHDTARWCWVCCQLRVPNTTPAEGAANSPARLALLPNLQ